MYGKKKSPISSQRRMKKIAHKNYLQNARLTICWLTMNYILASYNKTGISKYKREQKRRRKKKSNDHIKQKKSNNKLRGICFSYVRSVGVGWRISFSSFFMSLKRANWLIQWTMHRFSIHPWNTALELYLYIDVPFETQWKNTNKINGKRLCSTDLMRMSTIWFSLFVHRCMCVYCMWL